MKSSGAAAGSEELSEGEVNENGSGRISEDAAWRLTDEELETLARPVKYEIDFETEIYRSGKRHVRRTRYRENPYGRIAGRHIGACYYTIGQRRGLGIGGHAEPVFVIATDTERNLIYVGEGESHKGLYRSCLKVLPEEIHWIRPSTAMRPGEVRRYRVRIRYRQPLQDAVLVMREAGLFILFDVPQRGVTPGQFAVWYSPDCELRLSSTTTPQPPYVGGEFGLAASFADPLMPARYERDREPRLSSATTSQPPYVGGEPDAPELLGSGVISR